MMTADNRVPLWRPTSETLERATLTRYLRMLADRGLHLDSYPSLWQWSVNDLSAFWASVWEFFGLDEVSSYDEVLADASMPGARWFTGARVNFAERCLATGQGDKVAIVGVAEVDARIELTYAELRLQVASVAATLRRLGVRPGDHVAGYLPNIPEAVVAMLATAAVGAVWTVAPPDFGTSGVVARLGQVRPVVLFAVDSYRFGGTVHDRRTEVADIVSGLPTLCCVIRLTRPGTAATVAGAGSSVTTVSWSDATSGDAELTFADTAFDHPLWVLWSSGTTGPPKGIVHSHGGITVELLKALALGCDVRPDDRYFFVTSTGWMVWNFLVGGLLLGTTIVCYDGAPTYPDLDGAWRVAASTGTTVLGVGAAYLIAGHRAGRQPGAGIGLSSVRSILQTGSTLPDEAWHWVCDVAVPGVWLQSICGGTDVCSALAGASPLLPVYAGRLCAPSLGVDLQSWDPEGRSLVGGQGELVVTRPMPSMPLRLVDDPDGSRYRDSYFATYPGVWRHGDWITIEEDNTITVSGRSDSTLNRMGVRLGSAEIYGVLDKLPEITDSLVTGVEEPGGGYYLPLFVVPAPGVDVDDELRARIRQAIRSELSPRHVPDAIVEVAALPRTLTGKRIEVPVKRILQGQPIDDAGSGAIIHPEMLQWFADHARERREGFIEPPGAT